MDRADVSIATITLVRNTDEDRLLRASLAKLAQTGLPIAIADGGSPADFLDFVRALPGVTIAEPSERGLVPQVRASLGVAVERPTRYILYTEPDKIFFFERRLQHFIRHAPNKDDVGIVIAARSDESLETFPPFQRFTESTINRLCAEAIGRPGDYTYGPFLLQRDLTRQIDDVTNTAGWGWRPFLFATAHRLGLRLVHLVADLPCPADQRREDEHERVHRMRQLSQNVEGLVQALTRPVL